MALHATEEVSKGSTTQKVKSDVVSQRSLDLGIARFKSRIDAKMNVSPAARQFWNDPKNERRDALLRIITKGGEYKGYVKEHIWPGPLQAQIMAVCNLYQLSSIYGTALILFGKGEKLPKNLKGLFSIKDETQLSQTVTIARAFVNEYAKKNKISASEAWERLIAEKEFIRMLSTAGTREGLRVELALRKKYGLTTDMDQRRKRLAREFDAVAKQARKAGLSQRSLDMASESLGLSSISSISMKNTVPMAIIAQQRLELMRKTAEKQAQEEEERRKEEEEREKKEEGKKKRKTEGAE